MQQFQITLKNEKISLYNRLSWFIIIILILVYSYLAFFTGDDSHPGRKIALIIMLAVAMMLKVSFEKTRYRFGSYIFFYLLIVGFTGNAHYLLAGIAFFFHMLHLIATREKIVSLTKENIRYPSFPARNISWNSLHNCMLKDGLLTIDHKNDKIIQQVIDEEKTKINETEFNEFCRIQLTRNDPGNNKADKSDAVQGMAEGISIITGA